MLNKPDEIVGEIVGEIAQSPPERDCCQANTTCQFALHGVGDSPKDMLHPATGLGAFSVSLLRELWIRAHSRLGKIPVVLTLLGLSSSLQCTTKPSNFPLWEEKVIFLAFWGVLLISRKGVPTEMLPPNPGVLIHDWRFDRPHQPRPWDLSYANYG